MSVTLRVSDLTRLSRMIGLRLGYAITDTIPIIATTIISSVIENPFLRFIFFPFTFLDSVVESIVLCQHILRDMQQIGGDVLTYIEREFNRKAGERIRLSRRKLGLSQTDLAKFLSISNERLCRYESGSVIVPAWVLLVIEQEVSKLT